MYCIVNQSGQVEATVLWSYVTRGIAGQLALTVLEGSMEGTRGQRAMEEEDTGMVSCCRQPSDEEGRLERERL